MDVEKLLGEMTIQEKVGQMFLLAFSGNRLDEAQVLMEENMVGAAYISNENVPTPEAAYGLTTKLGQFAGNTRLQVPLVLGVDQEGSWSVMYPGSSPGPGNMAVGATGDPDMAYKMYEVIGKELRAVGLNTLLAPCADCNSNPVNSIIGMRSFGEKSGLVGQMTAAAVRGAHAGGVIATPKHFPGHGDTLQDSHRDLPTVSRSAEDLYTIDLHPFAEGIRAGAGMVMTAHIIFSALDPDNPATLSSVILNDVLRDQMGFDGVVLSDSMNMMAMKRHYDPKESAVQAFLAGVDLLMLAEEHYDHNAEQYLANQQALIEAAIEANASGTLPTARIDEAVRRVLTLKAKSDLTLAPPVDKEEAIHIVGSDAHRNVELEVATAAVSILRNRKGLLPLDARQKILLVNTTTRKSYEPL
ncbi:MAG: glycoside hydrolase family 3 protein [Chloroflexota bacterium]